ncbi:MAG: hypothetical protein K9N34_03795 [Candidatus Marinimicrobia bacterium]|nr:hypothetical protein [Candidatus Neomarinimicrobiota bacterium]MCF7839821.1 hypothetical protein [Candidatus Neomarinimicrobiota bacterium]MCF7902068.1 hypothetical protein [Candidatus Neomarinimicrobiota bacterium]
MTTLTLHEYQRAALAAMFVALLLAVGVTFVFIPNFELVTTTAFLTGYLMGPRWGWWVAGMGEALFSAMNPIGSGLAFPILFVFQILSMMLIAGIGSLFHHYQMHEQPRTVTRIWFGLLGGGMTLLYDFLTALSFPLTAGIGGWSLLTAAILGLGFFIVHIVVNSLLFALVVPHLMYLGRRQLVLHGIIQHV